MIFLLNADRVLAEIVILAKIKISETIGGIGPENVRVELEIDDDGNLVTKFGVDLSKDATELERKRAEHAVKNYWMGTARPALVERLNGLKTRRHG